MVGAPSGVVAASGLIGGYGIARWTKWRPLGGVALAAAGTVAARQWHAQAGTGPEAPLSDLYLVAFAGSHPPAKRIGAWPSVLTPASAMAFASWAVAGRRA